MATSLWKNFARVVFEGHGERKRFCAHEKLDVVVLQATGDRPTDEDALEMIAEADIDGDGRGEQKSCSTIDIYPPKDDLCFSQLR